MSFLKNRIEFFNAQSKFSLYPIKSFSYLIMLASKMTNYLRNCKTRRLHWIVYLGMVMGIGPDRIRRSVSVFTDLSPKKLNPSDSSRIQIWEKYPDLDPRIWRTYFIYLFNFYIKYILKFKWLKCHLFPSSHLFACRPA